MTVVLAGVLKIELLSEFDIVLINASFSFHAVRLLHEFFFLHHLILLSGRITHLVDYRLCDLTASPFLGVIVSEGCPEKTSGVL